MEEEKQKDTEPGETSCSIREVEKYHTIEGKTKKKVMKNEITLSNAPKTARWRTTAIFIHKLVQVKIFTNELYANSTCRFF